MPDYRLTYARIVIMETYIIGAKDQEDATEIAFKLETEGKLGLQKCQTRRALDGWEPKQASLIREIVDDDTIWEIEKLSGLDFDAEDESVFRAEAVHLEAAYEDRIGELE